MATEPNSGSIQSIADMLVDQPQAEEQKNENLSEDTKTEVKASQDAETEIEEDVSESDDDTFYDSDDSDEEILDDEIVDEDEDDGAAAVPLELSDDLEITYKADGQMKKATLGELKRSRAGQDYIQKGMEDNAKIRKELEQMTVAVQQEREKLIQRLTDLQNGAPQPPRKPSKELENSDPLKYAIELGEYRDRVDEYEKFQQEAIDLQRQQQEQDAHAKLEYSRQQAELLKQELPELRDPDKSAKLLSDIHNTAVQHYGVPEEILASLTHGWEFKIMRDAVAYQKLMAKRGKVQEKSKNARPMVKPGAKRTEDGKTKKAQEARSRMKQKGDINSVTDYLLS